MKMKKILLLLFVLPFFGGQLKAQHNPYLDKKKKDRPSAVMARQDKKELRRQKKMAKKQMRRSKRHVGRKRR
jgi:hypothetical protein